ARFPRALGPPVVELETAVAQALLAALSQVHEQLVRFDGVLQPLSGRGGKALSEPVRALRVAPPDACLDVRKQLSRSEAGLREQMPGALAPQLEIPNELRIEEHDCFCRERAVLGGAEGEHVDASAPGDIAGMTVEGHDGVRETRAVHVHLEP